MNIPGRLLCHDITVTGGPGAVTGGALNIEGHLYVTGAVELHRVPPEDMQPGDVYVHGSVFCHDVTTSTGFFPWSG